MLKKLIFLLLLLLSAKLGLFLADRLGTPVSVLPVTYNFAPSPQKIPDTTEASVLIIGDHHADRLHNYEDELLSEVGTFSLEHFKIVGLGQKNDGLHRTVHQLRNLKKIPKVIVYMGGGSEFYEKKFSIKDYYRILENIKISNHELKRSLMDIFPFLSKIFYEPTRFYRLGATPLKDLHPYSGNHAQLRIELGLFLYKVEFQELINIIGQHNSTLIAITTPLKRDIPPLQVCENTTTEDIEIFQDKMRHKLDLNKAKEVILPLEKLTETTLANARSYFLLGKAHESLGNRKKSLKSYTKSRAFDCGPSLGHPGFNEIIRQESQKSDRVILLDFDEILHRRFQRDALFETDIYPHDIHYSRFIEKLAKTIKEIYHL